MATFDLDMTADLPSWGGRGEFKMPNFPDKTVEAVEATRGVAAMFASVFAFLWVAALAAPLLPTGIGTIAGLVLGLWWARAVHDIINA